MSPDRCKRWFAALRRPWHLRRPASRLPPLLHPTPAVDPGTSRQFLIGMLLVPLLLLLIQSDRGTALCVSGGAGACALWAAGARPDSAQVLRWVQLERLLPLAAALCWNATVCDTGLYDLTARYALKWRRSLVVGAVWAIAAVGACADPVACTALLTPLTVRVMEELQLDPRPVLVAAGVLADLAAGAYERRGAGDVLTLCAAAMYFAVVFSLFKPHHLKEDRRTVELEQELLLWERVERALPTGPRAHALRQRADAERRALRRQIECAHALTRTTPVLAAAPDATDDSSHKQWKLHKPALLASQCAIVAAFAALACWPVGLARVGPGVAWAMLGLALLAAAQLPLNCLAARLDITTLLSFAALNFYGSVLVVLRFPETVVQYINSASLGRNTSDTISLRSCAMFWVSVALTAGVGGGAARPLAAMVRLLGAPRGTPSAPTSSYLARTAGVASAASLGHAIGSTACVAASPSALASAAACAQQGYPLAGGARARLVLPLAALLLALAAPPSGAAQLATLYKLASSFNLGA